MTSPEPLAYCVSPHWAKKLHEYGYPWFLMGTDTNWLYAYHCWDFPSDKQMEPFLISRETEDHHHQYEFWAAPSYTEIYAKIRDIKGYDVTLDADFIDCWNPAIYENVPTSEFQSTRELRFKPNEQSPHDDLAAMWCYLAENHILPKP